MKFSIKLITVLFIFLFSTILSVYAYTQSEIESMYTSRISNLENQRDLAIQELEKIYNDSITRTEESIKNANILLADYKEIYVRNVNICIAQAGSSGIQLSEGDIQILMQNCANQKSSQVSSQESIIKELNIKVTSTRNEKEIRISGVKNTYKTQIDNLINERDSTIQQLKETEAKKQAIEATIKENTNTQTEQQGNQTCQNKLGANATINYQGTCVCKIGYDLSNSNVCITKAEQQISQDSMHSSLLPSCQSRLGSNATIDSKGTCVCKIGHELGSSSICITKAEQQKEQEILNSSVPKEITKEYNSQPTVSQNYSYQKTVKDFKKSKILSIDTTLEIGTQVTLYKVIKTAINGTRDAYIAKIKVGKNGKITYRLKNHGTYKIIQ